jgi:hypothetical protein
MGVSVDLEADSILKAISQFYCVLTMDSIIWDRPKENFKISHYSILKTLGFLNQNPTPHL